MESLKQEAKELRPFLSDEEYDQLLAQHRRQLQDLRDQLRVAMERGQPEGAATNAGGLGYDEERSIDLVKRMVNSIDEVGKTIYVLYTADLIKLSFIIEAKTDGFQDTTVFIC